MSTTSITSVIGNFPTVGKHMNKDDIWKLLYDEAVAAFKLQFSADGTDAEAIEEYGKTCLGAADAIAHMANKAEFFRRPITAYRWQYDAIKQRCAH